MVFKNFDLHAENVVSASSSLSFSLRVVQSPSGEMPVSVPSSLDLSALAALSNPAEIGALLFESLFPSHPDVAMSVRNYLGTSLAWIGGEAGQEQAGLRIRLHLPPELQVYPWELLLDRRLKGEATKSDFLSMKKQCSIVRYEDMGLPKTDFAVEGLVRCVFAASSPESDRMSPLQLDKANVAFQEACGKVGNVNVIPVMRASVGTLSRVLLAEPTPMFVFYGHGFFPNRAESMEPGRIFLQDADGNEQILTSEDLAVLLSRAGVRLAVFISCSTGKRVTDRYWSGIAASLVKSGVGAVVAMQDAISERSGLILCEKLISAVSAGIPIDEAMGVARAGIVLNGSLDWYKPVLYMREDSGVMVKRPVKDRSVEENRVRVSTEFKKVYGSMTSVKVESMLKGSVNIKNILGTIGEGADVVGLAVDEMLSGDVSVDMNGDVVGKGATVVGVQIGTLGERAEAKPQLRGIQTLSPSRTVSPIPESVAIAIVTPIAKEYVEIQKIVSRGRSVPNVLLPTVAGHIGDNSVICMQLGKGVANSAVGMQMCLERWRPRWVILAGIAGSLNSKRAACGDIVVATHVYGLDFGKIVSGSYIRRPENDIRPDPQLLAAAESFAAGNGGAWRRNIKSIRPDGKESSATRVEFEYFLSGNQVVDDPNYPFIADAIGNAAGACVIEMEAVGAGAAIHFAQCRRPVQFLVVRGISDEVRKTSETGSADGGTDTRMQWKEYVTNAVGAFVKGLLERISVFGK